MSKELTIKDLSVMIKTMSLSITKQFGSVKKRFDSLEKNLKKEIKSEIEGLAQITQEGFNDLDDKMAKAIKPINRQLSIFENNFDQIKTELDDISKTKLNDSAEILTLKVRVNKLFKEIEKVKTTVSNL